MIPHSSTSGQDICQSDLQCHLEVIPLPVELNHKRQSKHSSHKRHKQKAPK
jgi:hypothetical protein